MFSLLENLQQLPVPCPQVMRLKPIWAQDMLAQWLIQPACSTQGLLRTTCMQPFLYLAATSTSHCRTLPPAGGSGQCVGDRAVCGCSSVGGTATGLWRTGTLGPNRFGDVALPWTGYCLYFLTESWQDTMAWCWNLTHDLEYCKCLWTCMGGAKWHLDFLLKSHGIQFGISFTKPQKY